jgi:transposase-like protein/transposase Tn5 family protein
LYDFIFFNHQGALFVQEVVSWINVETNTADFGDKRLTKRFERILSKVMDAPSKSIPSTFKSWDEILAAYRFFNQEKINPKEILSSHFDATLNRIKDEKIVLIPQDTSEIDFSHRNPIAGMGYLNSEERQGFYIHPSLAITPEKLCLGVIDFKYWAREKLGSRKNYKKIPIEEKESYRWLESYETANRIAVNVPNTIIVSIADREGDIYELLEKLPSESNKAFWIVRCRENRLLFSDNAESKVRLWEKVRISKPIGEIEFNLPAGRVYNRDKTKRTARKTRQVKQEVRTQTVYLKPPERRNGKELLPIAIHVVHCREINPPSEEERIEWFLLTSFPVNNAERAIEIVKWYLARWQIELFFKILKSGCKIEELQFDSLRATSNCIAVYLIVAWRILYLTMLGREAPDVPCNLVFEDCEWKSVYCLTTKKKPPEQPPKLRLIILMIAKLGGFLARKSDGFPGCKVMWIGMQRMRDFAIAWETFHSLE